MSTHAGTCGGSGSVAFIDCLQDDELSLDVKFGVHGLYMHTSTQITENWEWHLNQTAILIIP